MVRKYSIETIAFGPLLREILKQRHISRESLADELQCSVDAVVGVLPFRNKASSARGLENNHAFLSSIFLGAAHVGSRVSLRPVLVTLPMK
jgi:hypothetical protein